MIYTLHQIILRLIRSKRMIWVRCVARMGMTKNVYKLLVGKCEGKRPLGRPRHRLKDIIKLGIKCKEC